MRRRLTTKYKEFDYKGNDDFEIKYPNKTISVNDISNINKPSELSQDIDIT